MIGFLEFPEDEVIVHLDDLSMIRALSEDDYDHATGRPMRAPAGTLTRVDTRTSGWFYSREDFTSIRRRLTEGLAMMSGRKDDQ